MSFSGYKKRASPRGETQKPPSALLSSSDPAQSQKPVSGFGTTLPYGQVAGRHRASPSATRDKSFTGSLYTAP
ncbi:hypothetical protein HMPREF7215_0459 [Pyramidobacter piscolens W5455]|uniref:Uncharacterized protein n=1 Tax=Pyramidobacter piscolens W5455 TaxID=352165 RepID=A0ABP2HYN7_9BACT|nr:hypothetical protein HMPREF7215_0459 [Pyramidobacter piscolens W5455]